MSVRKPCQLCRDCDCGSYLSKRQALTRATIRFLKENKHLYSGWAPKAAEYGAKGGRWWQVAVILKARRFYSRTTYWSDIDVYFLVGCARKGKASVVA